MIAAANKGRETSKLKAEQKKKDYEEKPKLCKLCNTAIPYDRRQNQFCGHSCSAKASNSKRAIKAKCLNCGESIRKNGKYCSVQCQQGLKNKKVVENWLNGGNASTKTGCSATIRKFLLEQCNNKCPKCGWGEINVVTGKVPLEVNHIDGDSTNNTPENLEILCPNCHSLTYNFRALNKNSKRTYR